ncbi:RNA-dependent RNA polymerase [Blechmonas luni leishbunyavirus 1]|uniref:RNA-directed RNA polymerase L n=1 Tax=Blechmonas luni leishbunyavirus 1 TaxID=2364198 RepID=A0A386IS99_9VIRU|nr:RNA-dependent RNA polymerase [Blechmonas luni leishbunyavirus 1]
MMSTYSNNPYSLETPLGKLFFRPSKKPRSGLIQYKPVCEQIDILPRSKPSVEWKDGKVAYSIRTDHVTLDSIIPLSKVRTLPHDLVSDFLLGGENSRNILTEPIWDCSVEGVCTPDFFLCTDNSLFVVELKTFQERGEETYQKAQDQYSSVLQVCSTAAHNLIVCVGNDSVVYSEGMRIYTFVKQVAVQLCQIGHEIQAICHSLGWLRDYDYHKGSQTIVIPRVSLPRRSREKLDITQEMVSAWSAQPATQLPERTIISNISYVSPPHYNKQMDKDHMSGLYEEGCANPVRSALRQGMLIVKVGSEKLPSYEMVANHTLSTLMRDLRARSTDKRPKHAYVRGGIDVQAQFATEDILRGLWSTYFMDPDTEIFRSSKRDKQKTERSCDRISRTMENRLVSEETIARLSPLIKAHADAKSEAQFRPAPIPLDWWAEVLCNEDSAKSLPVVSHTYIDGSKKEIPYQKEAWSIFSAFWQRLVEELNIGRYSAKGPWNRFHVQKIEPFDAYLFTHGTGPDSHQFYYLLVRLDSGASIPGMDLVRLGATDWWYTSQIQSMNSSKMSQWLNLHERLINLRFFWNSIFHADPRRARVHFAASLLIGFEAKQTTIDALSLFRYVYMELCKEKGHRNVYKVSRKFPKMLRTPVQSWVIYSMKRLMEGSESLEGVIVDEDDPSNLDFKNLRSWVDLGPIPSFSVILSLSYMHYVVPHPFNTGLHGRVAIMEKLLSEEQTLPDDRKNIGWSSKPLSDLGPHEFAVSFVRSLGQAASRFLLCKFGTFAEFWDEVSQRLNEITYSAFSTFKKSTVNRENGDVSRDFCYESLSDLSKLLGWDLKRESRFTPFSELQSLVDHARSTDSVRNVTIFVKDQQTGLREIFVLTMCMRVLIKFMEVVSRVINTCLPNETLSRPHRKETLIYQHSREVVESKRAMMSKLNTEDYSFITLRFSSSSDAKSWCQQFCMPVFGCFLNEVLACYGEESKPLRDLLMVILNLITNKHIHVDNRVKAWFRSHPKVKGSTDTFNRLSDLFNGRCEGLYPDESIVNKSNMMQGIPHETSSALHASYLMVATNSLKILTRQLEKGGRLSRLVLSEPVVTNMVSSDDSGIMFSLPIAYLKQDAPEAQRDLDILREILSRAGYNVEECKRLFSAKVSIEKSTIFAETPVFEFNSKFYVGSSVNTAEIKFVCSPMTLGYHTVIRERISEALSALSGCLREGVRQDQLDVTQLCLRRMHHRYLYTEWWKKEVNQDLDDANCPLLGTLPLVQIGLIGFLNLHGISDLSSICEGPFSHVFPRYCKVYGVDQDPSFSLTLRIASRYSRVMSSIMPAYQRLINEYGTDPDQCLRYLGREMYEDELVTLKLMSPGTRIAMAFVDIAKIHMASCYAATQPCIKMEGCKKKMSLRDAVSQTLRNQRVSEDTVDRAHNPILEMFVRLLKNSYRAPLTSEQARYPIHMSMYLEGEEMQSGRELRQSLLDGWRFGFAGQRLRTLEWAQARCDKIRPNVEDTLKLVGGLQELDRLLNELESKCGVVHALGFKPLNLTMTEKFGAFLMSNMSRTYSLLLGGDRFDPEPCNVELERLCLASTQCVKYLSMEGCGWSQRRINETCREKASSIASSVSEVLSSNPITYGHEVLLAALSENHNVPISLLSLGSRGNLRFFLDSKTAFQRIRTHWYKIYRSDKWYVGRLKTSPMLSNKKLPQVTLLENDFMINSTDLRVDVTRLDCIQVRSNLWNSECHKEFPSGVDPMPWESVLVKIPYCSVDLEEYCDLFPTPFNTSLCRKITTTIFGCRPELRSWKFWEDISSIKSQVHGDGAYSMSYHILKKILPKWQSKPVSEKKNTPLEFEVLSDEEFEAFFNEIMDAGIEEAALATTEIPQDQPLLSAEELFSIDYFGADDFTSQGITALDLVAAAPLASDRVLRQHAMDHAAICFVTAATIKTTDAGLFGPPDDLKKALDGASARGEPILFSGSYSDIPKPCDEF